MNFKVFEMLLHYRYVNIFRTLSGLCICLFFVFQSCTKEIDLTPPSISFSSDSGYTSADRIVPIGKPMKLKLKALAGGSAITNLVVTLTNENGTEIAIDTGIYTKNLNFIKQISYGALAYEKWTFKVRDKNGQTTSATLNFTKDPNSIFGPIAYYPSIIIGTHYNQSLGSFLNAMSGHLYKSDLTNAIQDSIQIITYWGDQPVSPNLPSEITFSSPAENEVVKYYPALLNWSLPKNEVRYKADSITVSTAVFDEAYNDSLIIANYTSATVGKRKFKNIRTGYVIPFQITIGSDAGKRGLIKVKSMNNISNGFVEISMKIQK